VARHGKVLILRFSSGYSLLVHFGMTGQMYPVETGADLPDHTRTIFELEDRRKLIHVDVRRLGGLELVSTAHEAQARSLVGVGRDALTDLPSAAELSQLLSRRTCSTKAFLLDQRRVAGIGNIYASEVLARARIAPDLPCDQLTTQQVRALRSAIRQVLGEAVRSRGTTVSDYRTGLGTPGRFQRRLRVYGREGRNCMRSGCSGTIVRLQQGQRSTYLCPVCQGLHRKSRQE